MAMVGPTPALEPGWLTEYRCSKNPRHRIWIELAESGGELPDQVDEEEPMWCLWGDDGQLERQPGAMQVQVVAVAAPTGRIPPGA